MKNRLLIFLALGAAVLGCRRGTPEVFVAGAGVAVPGHASATTRTLLPVRWNTQLAIHAPAGAQDWQPLWIATSPEGEYVFDGGAGLLYAFDSAGQPRWRAGDARKTGGRFQTVRDLRVAPDHSVWVLDVGTESISVLDPSGTVERRISLDSVGYCEKLLPLAGGSFVAWRPDSARPFALVDRDGRVTSTAAFPWSGYTALPSISRFGSIASSGGGAWSFAFANGDGWFAFDSLTARPFAGHFVETVPFPAVVKIVEGRQTTWKLPHRTMAALSTWLDAKHLYVLFGGQGPERARRLDLYDPQSGRYQGTWSLPFAVSDMSRAGDRWTFVTREATPRVIVMTTSSVDAPRTGL